MATCASPDVSDGELELETNGIQGPPKNTLSDDDLVAQSIIRLLSERLSNVGDNTDAIDLKIVDELRKQQYNENKQRWLPGFLPRSLSSLSSLVWKPNPIARAASEKTDLRRQKEDTELCEISLGRQSPESTIVTSALWTNTIENLAKWTKYMFASPFALWEPGDGLDGALVPTLSGQSNYATPLLDVAMENQRTCQECSAHQPQDLAHWMPIHPTFSEEHMAITHSFQSSAGRYECTVSGLRWVCEGEVHFTFVFSSWEPYRHMLKTMMYAPVGPLLDITVIAGKLKEVYLPHFACLGDSSLDDIKAVHIEEDGNISIEPVCALTPFYVKLLHTTFSPKGVLLKTGLPFKVHCNLMLYQVPRAQLTIHAYLIPCDASIEQAVEKQEALYGHRRIPKPKPEKSFKMKEFFSLRTSCPSEVIPDKIKLRYPRNTPNYFEVYIKEANFDLGIDLLSKDEVTWALKIREVEYKESITKCLQEEHFVDRHRSDLIQRVSEVKQVMDQLLEKKILSSEAYDVLRAESTCQDQLRALYTGPLKAGGTRSKDAFYEILKRLERNLMKDLEGR